jgi:cytochrome c oxidase cbb3-type subunit 3
MRIVRVVVAELCVAGLLLGWSVSVPAAEQAADNYRTYCTQCHGLQGNGKGINVRDMSVQPRDHTDAKEMAARSDEDIYKVIKDGGVAINKSVLMPPWGDVFSDEEIRGLVAHLREMCQCSYGK